jgi:hypothetical protein
MMNGGGTEGVGVRVSELRSSGGRKKQKKKKKKKKKEQGVFYGTKKTGGARRRERERDGIFRCVEYKSKWI